MLSCDRDDDGFLRSHRQGARCYVWCVAVGAAVAPVATRRGRFAIYRLGGCRRKSPNKDGLPRGRWPSGNMPCKFENNSSRF